ncbi:MAG TPA: cytochrome oxidase small assembly protein [Burkholderiales bacterium]|nr:cytochrome oxidase small assembly protein [Burkholderiales bacterium]
MSKNTKTALFLLIIAAVFFGAVVAKYWLK